MGTAAKHEQDLTKEIVGRLMRQHSTAAVLFHHALAEHLGLGPTDHKCLDLLRERGPMTGSSLATITGLTTGAITGVAARLEQAGFLRREPDEQDRRQQILHPILEKLQDIRQVFEPLHKDMAALLKDFNKRELSVIVEFLTGSADLIHRHIALLRAHALYVPNSIKTKISKVSKKDRK